MTGEKRKGKYQVIAILMLIAIGIIVVVFSLVREKAPSPPKALNLANRKNVLELMQIRANRPLGISGESRTEIITAFPERDRPKPAPLSDRRDVLNILQKKHGAN